MQPEGAHDTDLEGVRHDFVRANGLRFHVARCGAGDRLALCLHGFPECWYSWRHQMPRLARLGFEVWAPDLRGYGRSERPRGTAAYAIEHLLDDVSGLIDAAGARHTVLIGHDWGAIIAWYYAMRKQRALDGLAILNVPHPAVMERALRGWRQALRSWYGMVFQVPWLPERLLASGEHEPIARVLQAGSTHPERWSEADLRIYRREAARPGALTAMLSYYRALLRGGARRQRRLGHPVIETPTLMLWGVEDVALRVETTYGTDRYVDDLTLRYLPGASHFVQQDAPDVVNTMLEAWLTGRPVPEAHEVAG